VAAYLFADLLKAKIPEKLWHYTDYSGFHGIVTSRKIWATDLRYLNDKEEFVHALNLAKKMLPEMIQELVQDSSERIPLIKGITDMVDHGELSPENVQVFSASFCKEGDRLSQWRGYSKGTTGVSLGFNLTDFRMPSGEDTLVAFAPCVYSKDQKEKLLRETISEYVGLRSTIHQRLTSLAAISSYNEEQREVHPQITDEQLAHLYRRHGEELIQRELTAAGTELIGNLLRLAALIKHPSFEEEQEWRFVLPITKSNPALQIPVRYRPRTNCLVPFIEFPLSLLPREGAVHVPGEMKEVLPLLEVILGPGAEPTIALNSACDFLRSERITGASLRLSTAPFRPW
jgi:hypothetical protein